MAHYLVAVPSRTRRPAQQPSELEMALRLNRAVIGLCLVVLLFLVF